jgi:hypothetical protein
VALAEQVRSVASSEDDIPLIDLEKGKFIGGEPKRRGRPPGSQSTTAKKRAPLPPWRDGVISAWAENFYTMAGQAIESFDEDYGKILQAIAAPAGQAWEDLARDTPQLRRFFAWIMTTGKLTGLVMAHSPLFMYALHRYGPARDRMEEFAEKFAEEMDKQAA